MTYVVATASSVFTEDGSTVPTWELRAWAAEKEPAQVMRQYRQAWPGVKVRQFTAEEWDALPAGGRSGDWVTIFNVSYLRE